MKRFLLGVAAIISLLGLFGCGGSNGVPAPVIANVWPNTVTIGVPTMVTISGTNLTGGTIAFSNATATNIVVTDVGINAMVTGTVTTVGTVTVTTQSGNTSNPFTVISKSPNPPIITRVTPDTVNKDVPTLVTVIGENLSGATLTCSNAYVANVVVTDSTVTATVTGQVASTQPGAITVTTPGGNISSPFTVTAKPIITSVSPVVVTTGVATDVTITGVNLDGITPVFSNADAKNVTHYGSTAITANVTGTAPNLGTVTVTNLYGSAQNNFTVADPTGPVITSVTPNTVNRGTETSVAIQGKNLTGAKLYFSNATATYTVLSDTAITATVTGQAVGVGTVAVTTPSGWISGTFTVIPPVPTITSVTPNTVTIGTPATVIITGTNLTGATLTFSNATATNVVVTDTTITATVTGTSASDGSVTVTTTGGSASSKFTVVTVSGPTITSVTPNTVTFNVPTQVVITGTNLTGSTPTFSNATAANVSINPAGTQITADVTGQVAGTGTVTVTSAAGNFSSRFDVIRLQSATLGLSSADPTLVNRITQTIIVPSYVTFARSYSQQTVQYSGGESDTYLPGEYNLIDLTSLTYSGIGYLFAQNNITAAAYYTEENLGGQPVKVVKIVFGVPNTPLVSLTTLKNLVKINFTSLGTVTQSDFIALNTNTFLPYSLSTNPIGVAAGVIQLTPPPVDIDIDAFTSLLSFQ